MMARRRISLAQLFSQRHLAWGSEVGNAVGGAKDCPLAFGSDGVWFAVALDWTLDNGPFLFLFFLLARNMV